MNTQQEAKFRNILEKKRDELISMINSINTDKNSTPGPIPSDMGDQSQDMENNEMLDRLEEIELKRLVQVNSALNRLDQHQYGVCVICGNEIPDARLMAIPYTATCINCSTTH